MKRAGLVLLFCFSLAAILCIPLGAIPPAVQQAGLEAVFGMLGSFLYYREMETQPQVKDQQFLDEAERFAGLSSGVYQYFAGSSPPEPAWRRALSQCELLLDSDSLRRVDLVARFVVFRCSSARELVVVFRGSEDPIDWLINFSALPTTSRLWAEQTGACSLQFHTGAVRQIEAAAGPLLAAIQPSLLLGYRLVTTGHSLGGGYATLFHLFVHKQNLATNKLLFTFGAPLFLYAENQQHRCLASLGVDTEFEGSSHHFVFSNDIVPRLLGSKSSQTLLDGVRFLVKEKLPSLAEQTRLQYYFPTGNFYHLVECTCHFIADDDERVNRKHLIEPDPMLLLTGVTAAIDDHSISQYVRALGCCKS